MGLFLIDNRFKKSDRLLKTQEFEKARTGQKTENRYFIAYFLSQPHDSNHPKKIRLGVTVTKKVGHAPCRSHIKRLVRETFRTWPHRFTTGGMLNVIARTHANGASNKDIFNALENIFAKYTGN